VLTSGFATVLQVIFPYFLISQRTTILSEKEESDSLSLYSEAKQTAYIVGTSFQILMFLLKRTMYYTLVCIVCKA